MRSAPRRSRGRGQLRCPRRTSDNGGRQRSGAGGLTLPFYRACKWGSRSIAQGRGGRLAASLIVTITPWSVGLDLCLENTVKKKHLILSHQKKNYTQHFRVRVSTLKSALTWGVTRRLSLTSHELVEA